MVYPKELRERLIEKSIIDESIAYIQLELILKYIA